MRICLSVVCLSMFGCRHPTPRPASDVAPKLGQSTAPLPPDPSVPPPDSAGTLPPADLEAPWHQGSGSSAMLEASHVRVGAASPPDARPTPAPVVDASAQRDASAQPPKKLPPSDGRQLPPPVDGRVLPADARTVPMR
jgi:hypothetical protein